MSNRDNKAAGGEFRELVGMDFDEFTRRAPIKLLLALAKFAESVRHKCCSVPMSRIRSLTNSARD